MFQRWKKNQLYQAKSCMLIPIMISKGTYRTNLLKIIFLLLWMYVNDVYGGTHAT